jgi:hypothetical protein
MPNEVPIWYAIYCLYLQVVPSWMSINGGVMSRVRYATHVCHSQGAHYLEVAVRQYMLYYEPRLCICPAL